jgi:spore coat protein U-like protein
MKKLSKIAAVAMFGFAALASNVASAASPQTGSFNVNINLTASCSIASPIADVTLNYTSFGALVSQNTTANVTCTTSLPYGIGLDSVGVTDSAVGIAYTITGVSAGTPTTGQTGTGIAQAYVMTVEAAAGQSGTCAAVGGSCNNSAATNKVRTLTVSW